MKKGLLFIYLLLSHFPALFPHPSASTVIIPRSQGRDKTRQLVGVVNYTHLADQNNFWGMGSFMVEYTQSFNSSAIARTLFGADMCKNSTIFIQGSQVANRNSRAWLADYFYLPLDFESQFTIKPQIKNVIVDFDLYIGLDPWWEGIYARAYGPFVYSIWDLHFCEKIKTAGTQGYPAGYFAPSAISTNQLLTSFSDYVNGKTIDSIDDIIFNGLRYGKISNCRRHKAGFADLRLECGWNFCNTECYHVGINAQTAMPTGNLPNPEFLFSPIIGNGNHWELGGGLTAHYLFWQNQLESCHAGIYFDANITHIFGIRQWRTFDLCGKPNSRYMLAEFLDRPVENNLSGSTVSNVVNPDMPIINPNSQFMRQFTPVANLSTTRVKVSAAVQADIVALFNVTYNNWQCDIGYNFWAVSCERIECPEQTGNMCDQTSLCNTVQENKWALKGDARVFGFMMDAGNTLPAGAPVALSATESNATIHTGTNALVTDAAAIAADPAFRENFGVDFARFAYGDSSNTALVFTPDSLVLSNQVKTSIVPQFIQCSMLNFQRLRGMSHKIFFHVNYAINDWWCITPFIGIGGFSEFGMNGNKFQLDNCQTLPSFNTKCSDCLLSSISQWGVWLKGGISF